MSLAECHIYFFVILTVILLSVIMLSVTFIFCYDECYYGECHFVECHYAECHYPECNYAECRYAECPGDNVRLLITSHPLQASMAIYRRQYICKFCKYLIRLDAKHYLKLHLVLS
jgi:hypothetical protein